MPTKSNLCLSNSLAIAAVSESDLYGLLTFHVPNFMSLFHSLSPTKGSFHFRGLGKCFVIWYFLWGKVDSISPNPQAGGLPLVGCPRLLIQYIRSHPPYWRPFLHPQHEDAPCHGDRDPVIVDIFKINYYIYKIVLHRVRSSASSFKPNIFIALKSSYSCPFINGPEPFKAFPLIISNLMCTYVKNVTSLWSLNILSFFFPGFLFCVW